MFNCLIWLFFVDVFKTILVFWDVLLFFGVFYLIAMEKTQLKTLLWAAFCHRINGEPLRCTGQQLLIWVGVWVACDSPRNVGNCSKNWQDVSQQKTNQAIIGYDVVIRSDYCSWWIEGRPTVWEHAMWRRMLQLSSLVLWAQVIAHTYEFLLLRCLFCGEETLK